MFIIDDLTHSDVLDFGAKGCVPRDFAVTPLRAVTMPLIPRSEWSQRIKEQQAAGRRLSDFRKRGNYGQVVTSLNQGPVGYCWAHSATHAAMLVRMVQAQPYVPLSAYAVAATIKKGRDEGGWGALALDFIADKGVPDQKYWAQGDRAYTKNRPGCWENAALHKMSEGWVDVATQAWDRDLSFDQVATCLLLAIPVIVDFNWWGHSVCALDLVETSSNQFGIRIWNSWGDEWGENGEGVLTGSKAIPDGATAPRVITPSVE